MIPEWLRESAEYERIFGHDVDGIAFDELATIAQKAPALRTAVDILNISKYMRGNPLLLGLRDQELEKLFRVVGFEAADTGEVVFRTGDEGDKFYLVTKVCASLTVLCFILHLHAYLVTVGDVIPPRIPGRSGNLA